MTDRPSSDSAQQGSAESPDRPAPGAGPASQPPGLGEQLGRTRSAALGLVAAHVDLAKAEFSEIVSEVKKAATLGSAALGLVFVAATILTVGSVLWLDEWIFGSMGWGVLHGTEIFLALAVILALAIVAEGSGRIVGAGVLAFVIAAIVFVVFGLQLTHLAFRAIGDNFTNLVYPFSSTPMNSADRAVAVAVIGLGVLFGLVGLLFGAFAGHGLGRLTLAIVFAVLGALIGAGVGAFLGLPMSWNCAFAVALAVLLLLWPALAAVFVLRALDTEKLKDRFLPDQTIDTTKETIEWVRAQTPLGRRS